VRDAARVKMDDAFTRYCFCVLSLRAEKQNLSPEVNTSLTIIIIHYFLFEQEPTVRSCLDYLIRRYRLAHLCSKFCKLRYTPSALVLW
jgi:hypothetical protein